MQATAIAAPPKGPLPTNRTEGTTVFEVAGVDFVGPIRYRKGSNREGKADTALVVFSLTRGVHLELLLSLETGMFLPCLKRTMEKRSSKQLSGLKGFNETRKYRDSSKNKRSSGSLTFPEHHSWEGNLSDVSVYSSAPLTSPSEQHR